MDTQVVMNWRFNESKKLFHSRENFLVVADRYIKENGAEALAKLIASKLKSTKPNVEVKEIEAHAAPEKKGEQWKCEEPNVSQKEIQVVEVTEIKSGEDGRNRCKGPNAAKKEIKVTEVTQRTFGGTAHWVKQTELNLGETKSNTTCIAGIKERATALMTAEIEACRDDRTPEISLHKKVQKEWACAVCLLTTQSEATLNSHLQGKRHQATSEQLKAKNQATKDNGSPSASMAKISDQSTKEEQPKCTSNNLNSKNNGISAASTVKKPDETKDDKRQKCASSNGPNQKNKKVWACALCQVTTQSEATLNSHLQGKRHQATSEQLKAKNQAIKTNGSPSASMAKKSDGSTKEEQLKCTSNNLNSKNNGISAASTVKKPDKTKEDKQQKCASSNGPNQKNNKNWACALCQVTTQSEATLNSHLQGKRHQATSEQPKGKNKATKASGSPSASMAKKSDQSTKEEQLKCTSNNLNSKNNGISAASKVKKPDDTKDDERQKCASSNGRNQKNNKKQEKALVPETNEQGHQKNLKQTGDGMKELGSWCNICNVSCTSELDMASHLNGRRHFDSIKQLSELWCSNCNVKCNSEVDMASHQNGRRHLEQLKERLGLWCSICSVSCNSKVDMDSHLNGRRHLDQIEEQLRFWCGAYYVRKRWKGSN
uniref:C2H2-type domain-containing protein n=1 Tax=Vitis vinifera TaxID=29760 RepID=F6I1U8_VITVI